MVLPQAPAMAHGNIEALAAGTSAAISQLSVVLPEGLQITSGLPRLLAGIAGTTVTRPLAVHDRRAAVAAGHRGGTGAGRAAAGQPPRGGIRAAPGAGRHEVAANPAGAGRGAGARRGGRPGRGAGRRSPGQRAGRDGQPALAGYPGFTPLVWVSALAVLVLCVGADLAGAALRVPRCRQEARVRQARLAGIAWAGGDLALVAIAVLAVWELRNYSAVAHPATGGPGSIPWSPWLPRWRWPGGADPAPRAAAAGQARRPGNRARAAAGRRDRELADRQAPGPPGRPGSCWPSSRPPPARSRWPGTRAGTGPPPIRPPTRSVPTCGWTRRPRRRWAPPGRSPGRRESPPRRRPASTRIGYGQPGRAGRGHRGRHDPAPARPVAASAGRAVAADHPAARPGCRSPAGRPGWKSAPGEASHQRRQPRKGLSPVCVTAWLQDGGGGTYQITGHREPARRRTAARADHPAVRLRPGQLPAAAARAQALLHPAAVRRGQSAGGTGPRPAGRVARGAADGQRAVRPPVHPRRGAWRRGGPRRRRCRSRPAAGPCGGIPPSDGAPPAPGGWHAPPPAAELDFTAGHAPSPKVITGHPLWRPYTGSHDHARGSTIARQISASPGASRSRPAHVSPGDRHEQLPVRQPRPHRIDRPGLADGFPVPIRIVASVTGFPTTPRAEPGADRRPGGGPGPARHQPGAAAAGHAVVAAHESRPGAAAAAAGAVRHRPRPPGGGPAPQPAVGGAPAGHAGHRRRGGAACRARLLGQRRGQRPRSGGPKVPCSPRWAWAGAPRRATCAWSSCCSASRRPPWACWPGSAWPG